MRVLFSFLAAIAMGLSAILGVRAMPASAQLTASTVYAWGNNNSGDLGNGLTCDAVGSACIGSAAPVPVLLPSGTIVAKLSVGGGHALALTSSGVLYSWGDNTYGEVGDGATSGPDCVFAICVATPKQIALPLASGDVVADVSAGEDFSLALTSSGTVYAWGNNCNGQLGNGTIDDFSVNGCANPNPRPVALPSGTIASRISAGASSFAITSSGTVFGWGYNGFGNLGDGSIPSGTCSGLCSIEATPVQTLIPAGTSIAKLVSSTGDHTVALTSTGSVLAWGSNSDGQLGNGSTATSAVPVLANLPARFVAADIAAPGASSFAVGQSGTLFGWGSNTSGQLATAPSAGSLTPTQVILPSAPTVTAIAGTDASVYALTASGGVVAWGDNSFGQLGVGGTPDVTCGCIVPSTTPPTAVSLPQGTRAVAISSGLLVGMAVTVPAASPSPTPTPTASPIPSPSPVPGRCTAAKANVTLLPASGPPGTRFIASGRCFVPRAGMTVTSFGQPARTITTDAQGGFVVALRVPVQATGNQRIGFNQFVQSGFGGLPTIISISRSFHVTRVGPRFTPKQRNAAVDLIQTYLELAFDKIIEKAAIDIKMPAIFFQYWECQAQLESGTTNAPACQQLQQSVSSA